MKYILPTTPATWQDQKPMGQIEKGKFVERAIGDSKWARPLMMIINGKAHDRLHWESPNEAHRKTLVALLLGPTVRN